MIFPEENFRMDIGIDPEKSKVAEEIKALAKNSLGICFLSK